MTGIIQEDIKQTGRDTGYMGIPLRRRRCQCLFHAYSNARVEIRLVMPNHKNNDYLKLLRRFIYTLIYSC